MHSRRLMTGFLAVPILLLGVLWSYGDWLTASVIAMLFMIARKELVAILNCQLDTLTTVFQNALAAIIFFAIVSGFNAWIIPAVFLFYWGSGLISMLGPINNKRTESGLHALMVMYLLLPLAAIVYLRHIDSGSNYLFFILAVACMSDVGGYYGGKTFGKHKMSPIISPNKTWEGSISGVLFALVLVVLVAGYQHWSYDQLLWLPSTGAGYLQLISVTIIMALIAQWGDLFESMLKRDANVKDSGSDWSGHGGFLDMADSQLWLAPAMLVYVLM